MDIHACIHTYIHRRYTGPRCTSRPPPAAVPAGQTARSAYAIGAYAVRWSTHAAPPARKRTRFVVTRTNLRMRCECTFPTPSAGPQSVVFAGQATSTVHHATYSGRRGTSAPCNSHTARQTARSVVRLCHTVSQPQLTGTARGAGAGAGLPARVTCALACACARPRANVLSAACVWGAPRNGIEDHRVLPSALRQREPIRASLSDAPKPFINACAMGTLLPISTTARTLTRGNAPAPSPRCATCAWTKRG
jgi:hypothetical protein